MSIAENLAAARERVAGACLAAGRPEEGVALMAVSKMHPVEFLMEAYAAGHRLFGENRVQEFQAKARGTRGGVCGNGSSELSPYRAVAEQQDGEGGGAF